MTRMLNLGNVLELINDALDDRSFAQQRFIAKVHELILHVFTQPCDELETVFKKESGQGSRDVASISNQLASQMLDHLWDRLAIIHVAWGQTTGQQVAAVVDGQMQFEAVKPAHTGLAALGINRKDAVRTDAFGITDGKRGRINEADACTGSIAALQIGEQWNRQAGDQSHKARITDQVWEFTSQMHLDRLRVIGFEVAIMRLVKMDENRHHLALTQPACPLALFPGGKLAGVPLRCKLSHEIIDITKQFE